MQVSSAEVNGQDSVVASGGARGRAGVAYSARHMYRYIIQAVWELSEVLELKLAIVSDCDRVPCRAVPCGGVVLFTASRAFV